MIGGNAEVVIRMFDKENFQYDENGKKVCVYKNIAALLGWLDLIDGDSRYDNKAKIKDSTHIFICDYTVLGKLDVEELKADITDFTTCEEMKTAKCGSIKMFDCKYFADKKEEYDIRYIDDPMGLHEHLEIYLKKVGGQNG